ncbi:MAG: SUMF1/EgtB/PvdO family nonheme iron enzyme [Anaerolineae bacterium]
MSEDASPAGSTGNAPILFGDGASLGARFQSGGVNIAGATRVQGDLVGRDKVTAETINITYALQMPAFAPPSDLAQVRADYLEHLRRTYRVLDFKGIPQLDTFTRELLLEEVYVQLVARPELPAGETWERRVAGRKVTADDLPDELRSLERTVVPAAPVYIEAAMRDKARVVVIGDPGSGKSTLLKYLALRLAAEKDAPLPILLPLNAYAGALARKDVNLEQYLPEYFAGLSQGVAGLGPLFEKAIAQGQAVILLDGLDEVQANRARLVHRVEAFTREAAASGNRIVVTSRIVGYREAPLSAEWALYTLLDFDHAAIEQFAAKWCLAFEKSTSGDTPEARANAETEREGLLRALDANPGVATLASNPLLLTILALIKRQGVSLPNHRVELYELYLKTLITAWNKARSLDRRQVGPDVDYLQVLMVLAPLALWLRQENPTAGLVSERSLRNWLTAAFMGEDWGLARGPAGERARGFLDSVRRYSNLLLERGRGQYGFIHLTFEEMLAAYGLAQKGQLDVEESLAIIRQHLTDPGWRETILLSVGVWGLLNRQPRVAGQIVREMLKMKCSGEDAGRNVLLAGACLEDVGELGLGRAAASAVTQALRDTARERTLPPAVQRDAGFKLGATGWVLPDLDAFVQVPASPFMYGDPKRRIMLDKPFEIGKYPVTNLQYQRFGDANGYRRREFWSDEGWAWRTGTYDSHAPENLQEWLKRRPPEKRGEPFFWRDPKWNNPLAPVMSLCWFEAEAYCNWLAHELGKPVRLPTEEEWERAARGTDGRDYPWGNKFDHRRLNSAAFWGGQDDLEWTAWLESDSRKQASTTMVGQFPEGNSPVGLADVSGNVWEWTGSWYETQQVNRVLRGGSWGSNPNNARCTYRIWVVPAYWDLDIGFRVVIPA